MSDVLNSIVLRLDEYVDYFFGSGGQFGGLFATTILIILWLASGAFAASVAEKRLHGPYLHFFAGLLVPVLYPLAAMALLRIPERFRKKKTAEQEEEFSPIDAPPPVSGSPPKKRQRKEIGTVSEDTLSTHSSVYSQAYFKGICFDEVGRSRGPFSLVVEGVELRIERIVDAMEQSVAVETVNADGKLQTLRVPYEKIESCREI